jgi:RimJ/RimL family protein N-acetyltransferase
VGRFGEVELDDLEISGGRAVLRRWQAVDADRVEQIMRDRSMREFLALPDPYTYDEALRFVTEFGHEGRGDGTGLGCAIVEAASGRVVGSCALRLTGDPEIGYWVAPDARGHGFAAEAARLLARFAFDHGVPRVRLACDGRNLASAATALKAGFAFEGISRHGITGGGRNGIAERRGPLARFARLADDPDASIAHVFPPLPTGGLGDGVVGLRVASAGDAQAMAECEDAESVRWNFDGRAHDTAHFMGSFGLAGLQWMVGPTARLAMVDLSTGRFAGQVDARRSGPPQVYGVGYSVHPAFRGRGYTTRALQLLAAWAFEHADAARLELGAKTGNVASQRAAANAGFAPDGVRRGRLRNADGTFSDEVRFCLLNPRLVGEPAG